MCLESVVPSLFPFLILSGIITTSFTGVEVKILRPVGRLCGIPSGGESLLLIGLIGGYPVGAQCIYRAYETGQISKVDAQRMLGFCNNAGPAFIFGITASLFDSLIYPWLIWGIQILSAIAVGAILPCKSSAACYPEPQRKPSITSIIEKSVKTMGIICGWIISANILIGFLEARLAGLLPSEILIALEGSMELSNGCINLHKITSHQLRFIYANAFLSFGGLCVWLQTISVTGKINRDFCYLGKLLQTSFCVIIGAVISTLIFPTRTIPYTVLAITVFVTICILVVILKKIVALRKKVLYNSKNKSRKELSYALS